MTEQGSDAQLLATLDADPGQVGEQVRADRIRGAIEEWRVSHAPLADDEPGRECPDPDESPPADELHDEYDPLPPA